jgi:hypothetical protein
MPYSWATLTFSGFTQFETLVGTNEWVIAL